MSKILVESSCSSASTHRMTQPSTTLNRRYVRRPANIAVEEAARAAEAHDFICSFTAVCTPPISKLPESVNSLPNALH